MIPNDGDRDPSPRGSAFGSIVARNCDIGLESVRLRPGDGNFDRGEYKPFVVVVEAADVGSIGETLNSMSSMPGVLSASLVFQGTDDD